MKKRVQNIILIMSIIVFVFSAVQLGRIFYNYYMIEKQTEELIDEYTETDEIENYEDDALNRAIDFDGLKEINEDVIAWIYIPDTKIDEPVLQGENNDSYIHTGIDGKYNFGGCIFIDQMNSNDFLDANTIFYGHRLKNGSRFNNIGKYVDKDFYDAHNTVYLYLPDGSVNVYKIYALAKLNAYSDFYSKDIDYQTFTRAFLENAIQSSEVSEEEAPLIMLSTCVAATGDDRYAVSARLEEQVIR